MAIRLLTVLLPVVLVLAVFHWGAALLLWLVGWWAAYVLCGGLRQEISLGGSGRRLTGFDEEPGPRLGDDSDGNGAS